MLKHIKYSLTTDILNTFHSARLKTPKRFQERISQRLHLKEDKEIQSPKCCGSLTLQYGQ
jgi:hypothetical protein